MDKYFLHELSEEEKQKLNKEIEEKRDELIGILDYGDGNERTDAVLKLVEINNIKRALDNNL